MNETAPTDDDLAFLARFERCELPESEWTHLAHVRVAWTCLAMLPLDAALERIRGGILRYNTEVLQRPHKYHETVTVAFAIIVAGRLQKNQRWDDFRNEINDILDPEKPVLLRYYSQDRLFSDAARLAFVAPDLAPLPVLRPDDS